MSMRIAIGVALAVVTLAGCGNPDCVGLERRYAAVLAASEACDPADADACSVRFASDVGQSQQPCHAVDPEDAPGLQAIVNESVGTCPAPPPSIGCLGNETFACLPDAAGHPRCTRVN